MPIKNLAGKILITGELELLTGMHIGTADDFAPIGAVDKVVVRDPITKLPIIPGSSLKGKMRTLLAKMLSFNDSENLGNVPTREEDDSKIKRLFGSSKKNDIIESRLQFYDLKLSNPNAFNGQTDLYCSEIKFENSIDRKNCVANPRQLERVPAGAKFNVEIVYNIEHNLIEKLNSSNSSHDNEMEQDFINIANALILLTQDYIGGHGTRGYGKVKVNNICGKAIFLQKTFKDQEQNINNTIKDAFTEVNKGIEKRELLLV